MQRTLIITGASSGIGLATAANFHKKKYRIINISRTPCDLPEVINLKTDLSNEEDVESTLEKLSQILETKHEISLVHNAFPYFHDSIALFSTEKMQQAFKVAIMAPARLNQATLPYMNDHSSIIFVGSTLSEKAVAGCMTYVTLKHALVGLMRSCTQDLSKQKQLIHTTCICPGFTETEMLTQHAGKEVLNRLAQEKVCLKRLACPKEVAALIYFCSQNALINGSIIHGNLGQVES